MITSQIYVFYFEIQKIICNFVAKRNSCIYGKTCTDQKTIRERQGLGYRSGRRRRHGPRRGGRRDDPRAERSAARKDRLRQMHLEPQYEARARRRPLPAERRRHAGTRSPARTRPHESQRPTPGQRPGIRDLELQLLG